MDPTTLHIKHTEFILFEKTSSYILVVDDQATVTCGPVSADVLMDAPVTLPAAAYTTTTPKKTQDQQFRPLTA